jgi:hypothetical protein
MPTEEIKKYDVAYYGGGMNASNYAYRAIIGMRRDDGSLIGAAYFHRSATTMPSSDSVGPPAGYISCHYLAEDYPRIVDLVRNEKPIYVTFTAGGWDIASIETSLEPIGEGEPA